MCGEVSGVSRNVNNRPRPNTLVNMSDNSGHESLGSLNDFYIDTTSQNTNVMELHQDQPGHLSCNLNLFTTK